MTWNASLSTGMSTEDGDLRQALFFYLNRILWFICCLFLSNLDCMRSCFIKRLSHELSRSSTNTPFSMLSLLAVISGRISSFVELNFMGIASILFSCASSVLRCLCDLPTIYWDLMTLRSGIIARIPLLFATSSMTRLPLIRSIAMYASFISVWIAC